MAHFDDIRLDTPRLILRPPREEDLDAWTAMMNDEIAARFIGGVMPKAICWRPRIVSISGVRPGNSGSRGGATWRRR